MIVQVHGKVVAKDLDRVELMTSGGVAYELLIPWAAVRWALAIITLYSLIWVFGLYASLQTLPYRLESAGTERS